MCGKMAEHAANQRDFERAIKLYKEALQYDPEHASTLLALAKLYMQVGFQIFSLLTYHDCNYTEYDWYIPGEKEYGE